ncbi:MAG TPA: hypothetical protein VG225_14585 [Terracidiphilus sp.]|jgi:hypothetical protein|nr:hypothetical protein [Terracidiphilus sp.]
MNKFPITGAVFALASFFALPGAAQDRGMWRAASSTASAITGDIFISDSKLTINFLAFPLAQIRPLTPVEIGAVFDADSNIAQAGNLYRLRISASQRFLHHNTLCGSDDTQWMATFIEGRSLHVAFFSGSKMPVLTFDAMANSTDRCATLTYTR